MIYLAGHAVIHAEADGMISRTILSAIRKKTGMRRVDFYTIMLYEAARQAIGNSVFKENLPEDTGIIVSGEFGPQNTVAAFLDELRNYPEDQVLSGSFSHSVHNAAASYLAAAFRITGPELTQTGFEEPRRSAFRNAEAFLIGGYAQRILLIFALEHGYITDELSKTREIPPEYAEAFLLSANENDGSPFSAELYMEIPK